MKIHSLTATFGCLENRTLDLDDGLNLITAPNEAGKSTWSAFIRTILYGIPTRERGALADKNRFAPWSGATMRGRLDCETDGKELTIIRNTVRANAPMADFFAAYAGTAESVADLTGQNIGESLTGVSREVFERSAFIRQSGLAIEQSAELERRISSLITAGDEDTSYTEAYKQLKDQLNKRRHNKTGLIPKLEEEEYTLRDSLGKLELLRRQSNADAEALPTLSAQRDEINAALTLHDKMDTIDAKRALFAARDDAAAAAAGTAAYKAELEQAALPPTEHLSRLKFSSANLITSQVSMRHIQPQIEQAKKKTAAAQAALSDTPFGDISVADAEAKAKSDAEQYSVLRHKRSPGGAIVVLITALFLAATGAACYLGDFSALLPFSQYFLIPIPPIIVLAALLLARGSSKKRNDAAAAQLLSIYNVSSPDQLSETVENYTLLYNVYEKCLNEENQLIATYRAQASACEKAADEIMAQVRLFSPEVSDMNAASRAIEGAIQKYSKLTALQNIAEKKQLRYETLRENAPDETPLTSEELSLVRPAENRNELQLRLNETLVALQTARSRIDSAQGQMSAIGDEAILNAQLDILHQKLQDLQIEYDAIAMAMEDLEQSNTELQNRFSPALGKRASEILSQLTGNRYNRVLLDRSLTASAEESGSPTYHEAALLSQGTADQLYLAVRLAICDLVLPQDKQVPLILDDALTNFDDTRMAAALEWLINTSKERQILLFTCQNREKEYLQNRADVRIISL